MTAPGRDFELEAASDATQTARIAGAELRAGELVAGRFRIEELLGIGGMGVVYRAHDEQLQVPVALKLLRPELQSRSDAYARFRQELLLARQVSSPHVVRIHDLVQHEGRWLISMDYVRGQSLERYLDTHGPMPLESALTITAQLAEGLSAAHRRGVIHRDLKPANVLLGPELDAYVSDFGVARSASASRVTGSGVIVGTPEYLSPEQARAERVDQRSDLYALGLILYEMLTGKLPFPGGTPAETLAQRIVRSPAPITRDRPGLPRWVVALTTRLLQLRPARRFQSAQELMTALERKRVPFQFPEPARVAALALGLALVVGAVSVFWYWRAPVPAAQVQFAELALLPMAAEQEQAAGVAAALAELLGQRLMHRGNGVPSSKVEHVLAQLGYDRSGAERHARRAADALAARRLLSASLGREGDRFKLSLSRITPGDSTVAPERADTGWVTADALAPATDQTLARLGVAAPATAAPAVWPQQLSTWESYGRGLLALRKPDPEAALAAFGEVNRSDPGFAPAWRQHLLALERYAPARLASVAQSAEDALKQLEGGDAALARAQAALALGAPERADELLKPITDVYPSDHEAQLLRARALTEAGDYAGARALLLPVTQSDPEHGEAWLLLGRGAIRAGEAQRGVDEFLVRAQIAYTRLGDARGQADTWNVLGVGYERLGQVGAAIEHFERAAEARERLGDARGAAQSLRNLSSARAVQGDHVAAERALDRARALIEGTGDRRALADVDNALGVLEEERGDFAKALVAYKRALALRQELGDAALIAESLVNVGFCYYQGGEFDNAGVFWQQARDEAAKAKDLPGQVRAQQGLSLWQVARGDWVAARALLEQSLSGAEEQQMLEEQAVSLAYLADLERLEGRVAGALERAGQARKSFGERQDQRGMAEMALLQAAVYLEIGAFDRADQALAPLAKEAPSSREQQALLALRQGELALARGDAARAGTLADQAVRDARMVHSEAVALPALLLGARARAKAGDATGARATLAEAQSAIGHYRPVPLQLELASSELAILPASEAVAKYPAARALVARLPGYGRAHALHAQAAKVLEQAGDADGARAALALAQSARAELERNTPEPLRAARVMVGADKPGSTP